MITMKLSTPNLFVNRDTRKLQLKDIKVSFPSRWIAKRDIIIEHQYNDDTEVTISIDPRGFFMDISYRGHEYYEMRSLDQRLLRWALTP